MMPLLVPCNIQARVINVQCFRYPTTLYYRRVTAVSKFSHRATAARTILHTARSCCGLRTRPLLHLHSAIVTCDIGGVSETVNTGTIVTSSCAVYIRGTVAVLELSADISSSPVCKVNIQHRTYMRPPATTFPACTAAERRSTSTQLLGR